MGKLHEVIAVESDQGAVARKLIEEAIVTFAKRADHFNGDVVVTEYFDDAQAHLNTTEVSAMTTTVADKLEYVAPAVARYWSTWAVKETTNQSAKADIILPDGSVFAVNVAATVLLGMEGKLKELRPLYEAIPTLQPGIEWDLAPDQGEGVYKAANPVERFVTKETVRGVELSPATPQHKAQVEVVREATPVAKRITTKTSSMLSPAEKSDLLANLDILIQAVKSARMRANDTEVVSNPEFGGKFLEFIHAPVHA